MALPLLFSIITGCEEKEGLLYRLEPAITINVIKAGPDSADVKIETINVVESRYLCRTTDKIEGVDAAAVAENGTVIPSEVFTIKGLEPSTEYRLFAVGLSESGEISQMKRDTIFTSKAPKPEPEPTPEPEPEPEPEPVLPGADGLYDWERGRTVLPEFADMTLCYGGNPERNPSLWNKNRFKEMVVYTDESGNSHWLFESMLMLEIWDKGNITYSIENTGKKSSDRTHWESILDYWFDTTYGLTALDNCIADAAKTLGDPPTPRYIVFFLPDPVYFENYQACASGTDKTTVYWGEIDGEQMDFSRLDHRLEAYKWFIDEIRQNFARKNYRHIELLGFYILSETLSMRGTWRYEYKQHDELIPQVAEYCHRHNEGLYWIPYSVGDHDHNKALRNWKSFGFDLTILQPNYYWEDKSWETTCSYINTYQMGMEMEFEGTHGEWNNPCSSILSKLKSGKDNPQADRNKARFREYMTNAKSYGIYGERPLVLYSGTNAMYELATSTDPEDVALYHEFCRFVIDSPLR